MRTLLTAKDVIRELGGTTKFAKWAGVSVACADAWRKRGFPSNTFDKMRTRLREEQRLEVSPVAWKQK
jgi:hypothetical protein